MDKRREVRNGELVDVYYDKNGEEDLIHWVRICGNSGRYPWTKKKESLKEALDNS